MLLPLPKAILFDFDGVIGHTVPAFKQAFWIFLRENHIQAVESDFGENSNFTKSLQQTADLLKEKYGYSLDMEALKQRIGPLQIELLDKHLEFDPSLMVLLEYCKKSDIKLAIGSNSYTERIFWVLEKMKIGEYFSAVVGADAITHHKPDPEVWHTCADMLNVPITDCLVIEDGYPGLYGAKQCGATGIYYHRFCRPEKACQEIAEKSVESFSELIEKTNQVGG